MWHKRIQCRYIIFVRTTRIVQILIYGFIPDVVQEIQRILPGRRERQGDVGLHQRHQQGRQDHQGKHYPGLRTAAAANREAGSEFLSSPSYYIAFLCAALL